MFFLVLSYASKFSFSCWDTFYVVWHFFFVPSHVFRSAHDSAFLCHNAFSVMINTPEHPHFFVTIDKREVWTWARDNFDRVCNRDNPSIQEVFDDVVEHARLGILGLV